MPDPLQFVPEDVDAVLTELVAAYEDASGRALAPADPERLFLNGVAYVIARQRALINHAARMNLLAYATGEHLDALGELVGVERLTERKATTVLRFFRTEGYTGAVEIPQGTRVATGGLYFQTTEAGEIAEAESFTEVPAEATAPGADKNGYLPRQLKTIVDPVAGVGAAENVTTTTGGAAVEGDEAFRARIRASLAALSVAGPRGAYRALALAAHPDVADCEVFSPGAGVVRVVVVGAAGVALPQATLDVVLGALSDETVRPLSDHVQVASPTPVPVAVELAYVVARSASAELARIQADVLAAVDGYVAWQTAGLGVDVNPSELTRRVMAVAGVKRVAVAAPAFTAVERSQIATVTSTAVAFGGVEDA